MKRNSLLCAILVIAMISLIILAGCSDAKMANSNAAALGGDDPAAEGGSEEFEDLEGEAAEDTAEPSAQAPEAEDTPLSESSWSIVLDTEISHPTNMAGFLNESFVITVGPYGEIHYSVDGGQTWPEGENESMCRFSLDIVDENIAWCGGAGNNVRSSVDGGKTWRALEDVDLGGGHANIDFIDDTTGWLAAQKKLVATNDAGESWSELALPEGAKSIAAICLRTANDGYLLTHDGLFCKTADGGAAWSSQDLEMANYEIVDTKQKPGLDKNNIALADISFSDENNGIIIFSGVSPGKGFKTWCLRTGDGGASWTSEQLPLPEGFSATRVFTSGDCNYITVGSHSQRFILLKSKE
ncbi:MAG: hypothetical protein GX279_08725 [Clostridiaceae bacterium]|jgi:photosystem II stability/assembly factor-like uncharacterized protein|nr:hypothetical protein [Clostridiaceae bacterium]